MSKGFAPILIVILIALGIGGYLLYQKQFKPVSVLQPSPSSIAVPEASNSADVSKWKTYINNSLGIYFKYPQDFSLKQTSAEQTILSIESADNSSFQLIIYENPKDLSLKEYESKNTGQSGMGPNVYYKDAELVKFQNIEAYYTKEETKCFSKCGSYVWTSKDKIYKLTGSSQNKPDQKQILDQILSTFKFLPASSTSTNQNPITWKQYKVKSLGLDYSLPSMVTASGDLHEFINPGQKGTQIFISTENSKVISDKFFLMGTTSIDYMAGREGMFIDLQGFVFENGKYYANSVNNNRIEIANNLVTKVMSSNGLQIIKINGESITGGIWAGYPFAGTPGKGKIGALVNVNKPPYRGLAIQMDIDQDLTEQLFDQILATFKFN